MSLAAVRPFDPPPPPFRTAEDLIRSVGEPTEPLIEGLLDWEGRLLIGGAEGSKKSLAALSLAAAVATGKPVWGRFPVPEPGRVVYLDFEMPRGAMRDRLAALRDAVGGFGGNLFIDLFSDGFDFRTEGDQLASRLCEWNPVLIVFDSLYRMVGEASLNDDTTAAGLIRYIDKVRWLTDGAGIVAVHHTRKALPGQARGTESADLFGSSVLNRPQEVTLVTDGERVHVRKDRNGILGYPSPSFAVNTSQHLPFEIIDAQERPEEDEGVNFAMRRILDAMQGSSEAEPVTVNMIQRKQAQQGPSKPHSRETISRYLARLREMGRVRGEEQGEGRATKWWVAP